MDLFGIGARARVKALEEALEVERTRNADLLKQVVALSDARAYKTLHPTERAPKTGIEFKPKRPILMQDLDSVVAAARDQMKARPS